MNFVTIEQDVAGKPHFELEVDGFGAAQRFKPTKSGLRDLARALVLTGDYSFCFSSSLDFPHEYGVAMSSNDIFAEIEKGISRARRVLRNS